MWIDFESQIVFLTLQNLKAFIFFTNHLFHRYTEICLIVNHNNFTQVLMMGQYSTGKTSFIKALLGKEYPGTILIIFIPFDIAGK